MVQISPDLLLDEFNIHLLRIRLVLLALLYLEELLYGVGVGELLEVSEEDGSVDAQ